MKNLGIVLVIIGITMMIITGFDFVTEKEVADVGSIEITREKSHPIEWSPLIGAVTLVGGIVIVALSGNKKRIIN